MRAHLTCALTAAFAAPIVGAAGCGGANQNGRAAQVAAADFRFHPVRLEVEVGDTVRWTNTGKTAHNVIGRGFRTTAVIEPRQSYSHRFTRPGIFRYLCTLHPEQMRGTVVAG